MHPARPRQKRRKQGKMVKVKKEQKRIEVEGNEDEEESKEDGGPAADEDEHVSEVDLGSRDGGAGGGQLLRFHENQPSPHIPNPVHLRVVDFWGSAADLAGAKLHEVLKYS